jgi:hypothetical protein
LRIPQPLSGLEATHDESDPIRAIDWVNMFPWP